MFEAATGTFAANKVMRELGKSGAVGYTETTSTAVFPEQVITLDRSVNAYPMVGCTLVAGEKYKVAVDGVVYKLEAKAKNNGGMNIVALGNMVYVDGVDTGDPFNIMFMPDMQMCAYSPKDGIAVNQEYPPVTIAVYLIEETIHPIDPKYLPEGVGGDSGWVNLADYGIDMFAFINTETGEVNNPATVKATAEQCADFVAKTKAENFTGLYYDAMGQGTVRFYHLCPVVSVTNGQLFLSTNPVTAKLCGWLVSANNTEICFMYSDAIFPTDAA